MCSSTKLAIVTNTSKEKIGQLNKLPRVARSLVSAINCHWNVYLSILLNQWLCADQTETSTSPPPGKPRVFGYSRSLSGDRLLSTLCALGIGNLTGKAFPGWGTWPLSGWLDGVGKIGSKVKGVRWLFLLFSAPKLLTAVNTCFDEMKEFKGRGRATS